MVSPADLRYLKAVLRAISACEAILLPDYSDTLDGPSWESYERIPAGGTPVASLAMMGRAAATVELGATLDPQKGAGEWLEERFGVPRARLALPIGIRQTDLFFEALSGIAGTALPARHEAETRAGSSTPTSTPTSTSSASGRWCTASRTWWSAWSPS